MRILTLKILFAMTWLFLNVQICLSQSRSDSSIPAGLCFVAESIELPFKPTKAHAYIETRFKDVQVYPAETYVIEEHLGKSEIVVGAMIEWNRFDMNGKAFLLAFIFEDDEGKFSGFPVHTVSNDDCLRKTVGISALREQSETIEQQVKDLEQNSLILDQRLKELRDKVSVLVGADKIIQVRSEVAANKGRVSDLTIDKQRLERLISQSKTMPEMEDVDILRRELSVHLQEAAKATATADRLNKRKKEAAMHEIQNNVALIKETNQDNPQDLARMALELRAERKRLEMRLGSSASESQNEF